MPTCHAWPQLPKFVRVSPRRFPWASATDAGLSFGVAGAPGEAIAVHVCAPGYVPSIRVVAVTLPAAGGNVTVACSGFDKSAACTVAS